jgi:hypothetical protein
MKVIFVDKVLQNENTVEPQLIDGRVVHWTVVSECMKLEETFREWLVRTEERISTRPNYSSVEGLLVYDMQQLVSAPYEGKSHGGMIIRYAFLRKKEENI